MFGPKVIETVQSKYSGEIKIMQGWGHKYIATGILTQSGDIVRQVWEPTLKKIAKPGKSWLILGLAGGTIAHLISRKFNPSKITGVEIDPVMVDLGKRYFSLSRIPNIEIINEDAKSYITNLELSFAYILVDMYFGDKLPEFVYDPRFIQMLSGHGDTIIFNHLFYDLAKKQAAEKLVTDLKTVFPSIILTRRLTNLLITCSSNISLL